jgi:hypothetical protein
MTDQIENTGEGQVHPKGHLAKLKAQAEQVLKDVEAERVKLSKKPITKNKLAS